MIGIRSSLCLPLVLCSALIAAEEDKCALAGTVRDSVTSTPLRKMNVVLYPAGGRTTYRATTNSDGGFSFDGVDPGRYRIGLEHAGYGSIPVNQVGALIRLRRGQKLAGLD